MVHESPRDKSTVQSIMKVAVFFWILGNRQNIAKFTLFAHLLSGEMCCMSLVVPTLWPDESTCLNGVFQERANGNDESPGAVVALWIRRLRSKERE